MVIDRKTFYAVAELVQAAAHQHGLVGPVPFTVSRPKYYEWCGTKDDPVRTACVSGPAASGSKMKFSFLKTHVPPTKRR